ncbi:hypothetical protein EVAR_88534_1 [Eumeta japonica]|uniref:Uncharacterized protein n=1 Tax=Eumeta variegata TaxID=151549 RepID=A0A4C1WNE5_EUMVA|nr:hypothetical protein EVAR_88534_1 [Eumeta japonica]
MRRVNACVEDSIKTNCAVPRDPRTRQGLHPPDNSDTDNGTNTRTDRQAEHQHKTSLYNGSHPMACACASLPLLASSPPLISFRFPISCLQCERNRFKKAHVHFITNDLVTQRK